MIEAVIFDMDGLLVDSEPLWRKAEIEVFGTVGVPLTDEMCHQTTGMRMNAAVKYWYDKYPWKNKSLDFVENEVIDRVHQLITEHLTFKPGAIEAITSLVETGVPIAICSSSPQKIIESTAHATGYYDSFQVLYSAEREVLGKPHPGAYLSCAKHMNVVPEKVLVFEDSVTGAISGKAASMKVVAVPEEHNLNNTRLDFCDMKLSSLEDFSLSILKTL